MKGGVSEETVCALIEAYLFEVKNGVSLEEIAALFNPTFRSQLFVNFYSKILFFNFYCTKQIFIST